MKGLIATVTVVTTLISFSASAARIPHLKNKKENMLYTIINNQPSLLYTTSLAKIKDHEKIEIPIQEFAKSLAIPATASNFLANLNENGINRFDTFVRTNNSNPEILGDANLQSAQNILLNVLYFIEVQKMLSDRTDLHIFGAESVKNLNTAISERIQSLYQLAQKRMDNMIFNKHLQNRLKINFLNIGLDLTEFLGPDYEWAREYVGLDKSEVSKADPKLVLENLSKIAVRKTNLHLKAKSSLYCAGLFL